MNHKRVKALVGIELYKGRLCAVELRRSASGAPEVRRTAQATLALDPFSAAPELAGREIKNALEQAGIRTTQCVVCLPLDKALLAQANIPDLPEADLASYLQLEAERSFPFAPEDLVISTSRCKLPGGGEQAILIAVLAAQMNALENSLRAAGLRPVSITLGATALAEPRVGAPQAIISAAGPAAELLIAGNGGFITLRSLGEVEEAAEAERVLDANSMGRDVRITFGRIPAELREQIKSVQVYGSTNKTRALKGALTPELAAFGITLQEAVPPARVQGNVSLEGSLPPGATAAAAHWLGGLPSPTEFLINRPSRMKLLAARYMARGLMWKAGTVVGAVVVLLVAAIAWQHWKLNNLTEQWNAIEPQVTMLENIQKKIHTFRPWFNDDIRSLEIAKGLTTAFPERGDVWARTLEIKGENVTCENMATSREDANFMLDNLRQNPAVEGLTYGQFRGTRPVTFSAQYNWNTKLEGARGE